MDDLGKARYSLAHAFCCFLASVEDVNPAVATRARLLLDTIKRPALQGLCLCLDFQFDTVVRDRPIILSKLLLLHFLKQDIPALSWEFFVNRFETLSLEAQLHLDCNKEFPFPTTITAVRTNVANLSDAAMWKIRRARFARNRQKSVRSLRDSVKGPSESKRAFSLPETLSNRLPRFLLPCNPDGSAPLLGQNTPEEDSIIKDLLPEDAGIDHQTVHHLIMVLMKFMAKDQSSAETDIGSAKAFNTVKRHLYVLLGYDQQEGCFMIAPQKMRISTCFNAFIAGIAQYPYRDMDVSKVVLHLIHITVNTLNAQYHSCRPHATAGPLYSDNSNISRYSEKEKEEDSVFDESDIHDTPTGACNKESQTFFARLKRIGGSKSVKYQPVELNAQKSEIELSEYREASALQDSILRCVREESTKKKRLQAMHKQKSLDIGNTDSILYNLDEHRRKSCIDRCDLQGPPSSTYNTRRGDHHTKESSDGSSGKPDGSDTQERRGSKDTHSDSKRPVIPEVRLSCMETLEDKQDSSPGGASQTKEDPDLIDLSSDCTSIPEKHSILSMSDSDSLVFEPLPPLRIVESDEEFEMQNPPGIKPNGRPPASPASGNSLRPAPVVQVSVEECQDQEPAGSPLQPMRNRPRVTPTASLELPDSKDIIHPEDLSEFSHESPLTLKQKRDLLKKTPAVPEMSLDDVSAHPEDVKTSGGPVASPSGKSVFLNVPEDTMDPFEEPEEDEEELGDDGDSDPKAEDDNEEAEFKIQIVPRQRKQRKIAVSAIQREYLDISFNTLDKIADQPVDTDHKALSALEKPRESASAPTLEAAIPETSSRSSISTQYRQVKRGSLGALTMSQLMKRQLEHQSSAPHNISTWETGATKTSLLSAPSTVSMFVPAPEEFTDEQPTTMTDRCRDCGAVLEEYDEETLGLAVVVLSMFIHLSPDLAAPLLLDIMQSVGRLASSANFSGQAESMLIPGNAAGVAKQFLRCVFHQLAPNGILPQLFQSNIKDGSFLRTLASSLIDFNELSSVAALNQLLEGLNNKKSLPAGSTMLHCLDNIASFMEALPMDSPSNLWTTICNQFQTFLTKLPAVLPLKSLLEPFSKLLSFVIQYGVFSLSYLVELCGLCYRAFNKSHMKACSQPLHEDTFGGNLKVGLAQVAAMEISKGNHRDNKAVIRYLPWLYHPPSTMQQGPKEFIECVSHIRQLSWLLLGSLTHCALHQGSTSCMPIPLDAGSHIADHLIVILIGFPEQSKTSVLHMCSLFHAFMFAQLWTIYCEQAAATPTLQNQNQNEFSSSAILTGLEFWSRVTPSILQLMAHNKVHLSAGLQLRLQAIQNRVNHQCLQGLQGCATPGALPSALRKWLQCTQFKMAQVEIQSSEAASQFYPIPFTNRPSAAVTHRCSAVNSHLPWRRVQLPEWVKSKSPPSPWPSSEVSVLSGVGPSCELEAGQPAGVLGGPGRAQVYLGHSDRPGCILAWNEVDRRTYPQGRAAWGAAVVEAGEVEEDRVYSGTPAGSVRSPSPQQSASMTSEAPPE
ncbi:hypothetical protein JZ751_002917 [Albula glossodonta]|uniref:Protein unc-79 homolog n=1 Tax=Albula glossodonta TaxID=121402 RepID=A0A8T2NB69_9TELE|nr:hypothetical protein JZ751_002917 [Albula glossodonta]